MVKTQEHSFETPDVGQIPDPVHEREFGPEDHIRHLGLRYLHGGLLVKPDIVTENTWISSMEGFFIRQGMVFPILRRWMMTVCIVQKIYRERRQQAERSSTRLGAM